MITIEEWYNLINTVRNSKVIEVEGGYTSSIFLRNIKDGTLPSFCIFKTREECEKFIKEYEPSVSF